MIIPEDKWMPIWMLQGCTELGWFPTSTYDFEVPIEHWINRCRNIFGSQWSISTLQWNNNVINFYYGGIEPDVKNVIFFNGKLDPWYAISRTEQWPRMEDDVTVINIEGGHCPDLSNYKNFIVEKIRNWTQNYVP